MPSNFGFSNETENTSQFEQRKTDHIRLSLDAKNEAMGFSGLDEVELLHEALPELDFSEVTLSHSSLGLNLPTPLLVSSMTAGHYQALDLNLRLAKACQQRGWMMGVGSQRRELFDSEASREWVELRKQVPNVLLLGNVGLSQLIQIKVEQVQALVDTLGAKAMIVHCNPLQEALQPEGTPQFKGGLKALERLCQSLEVPVILKETGCGFSSNTLERLRGVGLAAVDVSGYGGTHWGRIEGDRIQAGHYKHKASQTFSSWGLRTVDSVRDAVESSLNMEVWASGGVRTGRDAACLMAMGANILGFAKPILAAALEGEKVLESKMMQIEFELKVSMFCTGCRTPQELQTKKVWRWRKKL